MEEIKRQQVEKMTKLLESMGGQYHIKIGDEEFGAPIGHESKRGPIKNKGVVEYVRSIVHDIALGEVIYILPGDFDIDRVQACVHTAVPDGVKLATTKEAGHVQVMRIE